MQRVRLTLTGQLQGVGFRPYVQRLASGSGVGGWIANTSAGVVLEAEGRQELLQAFLTRLREELPTAARIDRDETAAITALGESKFAIRGSIVSSATALITPDRAMCDDCCAEIFDPANRRYRYPFTNCTQCGPRFSILRRLPHDRINTTMRDFQMCVDCEREYNDPNDRRFHAQPNACAACGPQLTLCNAHGAPLARGDDALKQAAVSVRDGKILALKGLGGYQLIVDAGNASAVQRLRIRKHRPAKPFAVMVETLDQALCYCDVSSLEGELLTSPQAPIVLLEEKATIADSRILSSVAPDNPLLGIMLAYTPLHRLLLAEIGGPVVATSGNLGDEPIAFDDEDALRRLRDIADLFLTHDRSIARPLDDSVVRVIDNEPCVLRAARGYAPLSFDSRVQTSGLAAAGGQLKTTVAVGAGHHMVMGAHIGDMFSAEGQAALVASLQSLSDLHEVEPTVFAHDRHPGYFTTTYVRSSNKETIEVQHHLAHVMSCVAENKLEGPVLGIVWDGSGYGEQAGVASIWGGEFLLVDGLRVKRMAHWREFPLPGGESAIREPCRAAFGLLWERFGSAIVERTELAPIAVFSANERNVLLRMLERGINSPRTSSVGRLFDAVAALLDLRQRASFEAQAAMDLEFAAAAAQIDNRCYPVERNETDGTIVVDWAPLLDALLNELAQGVAVPLIAARFHRSLIAAMVDVVKRTDCETVVLTGGCMQNRFLVEQAIPALRSVGKRVYRHRLVPPNDGGLALGQLAWAARVLEGQMKCA